MPNEGSAAQPDIVVLGYPAWGHTNPVLRLIARLPGRLAVEVWSLPPFRAAIEATGARFRSYPEAAVGMMAEGGLGPRLQALARLAAPVADTVTRALAAAPPRLLLHDSLAVWGPAVAARLGLPEACTVTTFAFNRSMLRLMGSETLLPPDAWDEMGQAMARLGSPALAVPQDVALPRGALKLVFTSRAFQPGGGTFGDDYLFLGPLLGAGFEDDLGRRDLTYVSMGTLFNRDRSMFEACLSCFGHAETPVIISLGGGLSPDAFPSPPPNCQVVARADQPALLRRARLFVTHGGMNGVAEAIAAGVPMILLPQDADQMLVAQRVARLGCGIVLPKAAVSAESLADCAARIEADHAGFARRCRALHALGPSGMEVDALLARLLSTGGLEGE